MGNSKECKFNVGDKIVCIETDTGSLLANDLKHGELYFVTDRDSCGVYVSDNSGNHMYACDFRFKLAEEKDMEQTAEQIRDEILRIDVRIEEAKKDIENAEKERNSLVEKLREKGFEIVEPSSSQKRFRVGDKVKVLDNTTSHQFPIGEVVKVESVHDRYYDCVDLDGVKWSCFDRDVEKI